MVFKLRDIIHITCNAIDMCEKLGFSEKQIENTEIKLEPVRPDGTVHFSLRENKLVIPEYHKH